MKSAQRAKKPQKPKKPKKPQKVKPVAGDPHQLRQLVTKIVDDAFFSLPVTAFELSSYAQFNGLTLAAEFLTSEVPMDRRLRTVAEISKLAKKKAVAREPAASARFALVNKKSREHLTIEVRGKVAVFDYKKGATKSHYKVTYESAAAALKKARSIVRSRRAEGYVTDSP